MRQGESQLRLMLDRALGDMWLISAAEEHLHFLKNSVLTGRLSVVTDHNISIVKNAHRSYFFEAFMSADIQVL
jgi:hypothetical protein